MAKNLKNNKNIDKNLIFLKSSVIALGLIFLILLSLLLFLKFKKDNSRNIAQETQKILENKCTKNKETLIDNKIDEIISDKNHIILLTKEKNNQQELLILDKKCNLILSRKRFIIK